MYNLPVAYDNVSPCSVYLAFSAYAERMPDVR